MNILLGLYSAKDSDFTPNNYLHNLLYIYFFIYYKERYKIQLFFFNLKNIVLFVLIFFNISFYINLFAYLIIENNTLFQINFYRSIFATKITYCIIMWYSEGNSTGFNNLDNRYIESLSLYLKIYSQKVFTFIKKCEIN